MKKYFLTICFIVIALALTVGCASANKNLGGSSAVEPPKETEVVSNETGNPESSENQADDSELKLSSESESTFDSQIEEEVGFELIPLMRFDSWLRNNGILLSSNAMGEYSYMYDGKYMYTPLSSTELTKENFMEVFLADISVSIDAAKSQDGRACIVVVGDSAEQLLGGEISYAILSVQDLQSPPGSVSVAVVIGRPSDIDTILEWYHEE